MEEIAFWSSCDTKRPVRLSQETRQFAWDSLHAKYGRPLREQEYLSADGISGFETLSPYEKYDACIRLIAEKAPLRLCGNELLCASAALGGAIRHVVPVQFAGETVFNSVSHLTIGFQKVLDLGLDAYEKQIAERLSKKTDEKQTAFLRSLQNVIASMRIWHGRYMALLEEKKANAKDIGKRAYYDGLIANLRRVPFLPPQHFREAVQCIWFVFAFTRLCGNWPGIGRLDEMLGSFLEKDLASGVITLDGAREVLAHFFIKGCEWITLDDRGSGDGQHYQNIVLSGVNRAGAEVTNDVTYLVLDVVEELPIGDFPIAVRVSRRTSESLLDKIARVVRHGSGVVAVYNEDLVMDSLTEFGYSPEDARCFANDGCWEVQVPGQTSFVYEPIDIYQVYENEVLGMNGKSVPEYASFEELYAAFRAALGQTVAAWHDRADGFFKTGFPTSVVALFTDDCIETARDYYEGGARYHVFSPHLGGMPDVVNSLYAIKKLVFEEKKLCFAAFMNVLKNNWEGNEILRRYVKNAYVYYGNDNDEVDEIMVRAMDDYMDEVRKIKKRAGVMRPAGISTFGRQIDWKDARAASAHGFLRGDILAGNLSPTPGTDRESATAIIRSHCKANLEKLTCGTALDIKLDPSSVEGDEGLAGIISLITGFVSLGGFFMQIDVLDQKVLRKAQKHPENYQNLAVRISGWSARFVTLCDEWQQMIIERTAH